jgi:hypothetical protein
MFGIMTLNEYEKLSFFISLVVFFGLFVSFKKLKEIRDPSVMINETPKSILKEFIAPKYRLRKPCVTSKNEPPIAAKEAVA